MNTMRRVCWVALLLIIACTQFEIDDAAFSQERMAHAATIGTMYLSSDTNTGDHECDDDPSKCCAAGYHMCTITEFLWSGREMEYSGKGRDTTPYGTDGDVVLASNTDGDCYQWSTTSTRTNTRVECKYALSHTCQVALTSRACTTSYPQWCCSR